MSLEDPEDAGLSALIRDHATRHAAPDAMRAGIRTQIALADASRAEEAAPARPPRRWLVPSWRTATVSFVLGAFCTVLILPTAERLYPVEPMDAELVTDHVRALRANALTQVVSTDRHTVKPWFQGRLDYAPPVIDLGSEGFPLLGGRVERVRGNDVATLAYDRNRHVIDLFVWPAGAPRQPAQSVHRGFNVLHWSDSSMQYWAVSDVERGELEHFARLWQERVAAQ